jgi:hypothetical protein
MLPTNHRNYTCLHCPHEAQVRYIFSQQGHPLHAIIFQTKLKGRLYEVYLSYTLFDAPRTYIYEIDLDRRDLVLKFEGIIHITPNNVRQKLSTLLTFS